MEAKNGCDLKLLARISNRIRPKNTRFKRLRPAGSSPNFALKILHSPQNPLRTPSAWTLA
ncbi:hypothetical protein CLOSTMETH_03462 [[Clostridium] methylpentosum DSM 5476]|uniref:Uncharacterized protein n=1 Tax=[Clostridium] methylpentosum DSM 5476 TaxID=537013 RepID=C0EHW7_9FIRM|nr:hypothetical protein CLOSTMETH_03462 [[Clostridium] methylpentosum DSM 5476]